MKCPWSRVVFSTILWLGWASYCHAQAPPLPSPKGVEMFDQGEVNPKLAEIRTPRFIKVEIVAEEPTIIQPRHLGFGTDGTPYAIQWKPGAFSIGSQGVLLADGRTIEVPVSQKDTADALISLHDRDGDGRFDEARIVMDDLELPSGLLIEGGWFYYTSRGRVIRRRPHDAALAAKLTAAAADKTGPPTTVTSDGKWIEQQLLQGLNGVVPFQAGGLAIGPCGLLYVVAGSGDNRAIGWDGSRATVLRSGASFRMTLDGSHVGEFARGFCNPRGNIGFDDVGNLFLVDGGIPEGEFALPRLIHVVEGADYGWQHAAIAAGAAVDRQSLSHADPIHADLEGRRPGNLPAVRRLSGGSPAGIAFPKWIMGMLVTVDWQRHVVQGWLRENGSRIEPVQQFDLLTSEDSHFCPCHAAIGPDGALFVVDCRSDPLEATKADEAESRIYRLSWSGTPDAPAIPLLPLDRWAKLVSDTDDKLFSLLAVADSELRRRAASQIVARAHRDEALAGNYRQRLIQIMNDPVQWWGARSAAVSAASQLMDKQVREALSELLTDARIPAAAAPGLPPRKPEQFPEKDFARLAAEALSNRPPKEREEFDEVTEAVKNALAMTTSAELERSLRLALGKLAVHAGLETAEWGFESMSVTHKPKTPREVFDGHVRALEMVPGAAKELMLGNLDVALNFPEADPMERQRLKEFVTLTAEAMRTRELTEFLDALLLGEDDLFVKIEAPLEARLIACYQNVLVEPPINADAVVAWLEKHPGGPPEVEIAALETISLVGTTKPDAVAKLAQRLLAKPQTAHLLARRLLSGHLVRSLLPQVTEAIKRHAASNPIADLAAVLAELEKLQP